MYPILFVWGDGALYTYTTLLSIAIIAGGCLWVNQGKLLLDARTDALINAALGALLLGFLGARLLFILTNIPRYQSGLFDLWTLSSGGIVFYGGLIGGGAATWHWAKRRGYSVRTTLSAMAPGLALAHAIGRLGCLAHGCCHGRVCNLPWAITFTDPRALARPLEVPLHPTQVYEVLGLSALAYALYRVNLKYGDKSPSYRLYFLGYGTLRFFVEFFRGDFLRGAWAGLSTSQWLSLALIICGLFLDFGGRKDHNSAHENRT